MVAVWRHRLASFAFALSVTLGCQSREPNSDLANFLQPSRTLPESPYTLSGTIIESGAGGPLANVLVESTHGRTTLTNESGFYEFREIGRTDLYFSNDGFETRGPLTAAMIGPTTIDAAMQQMIRVPASQVLTAILFPNDPYLNVRGDSDFLAGLDGWVCGPPCKVMRVAVPLSGRLRARVTWQQSSSDFSLFLAQRIGPATPTLTWGSGRPGDLTAEMPVTGGTDARVYFGLVQFDFPSTNDTKLAADVPFQLTTSISP